MKIPLYILTTLFVLGLAFALPGTASAQRRGRLVNACIRSD